jgi:NADPH2:quinone reductase
VRPVIIDIVAGADMPSFFARLNPNGRMVVVGVVAGYPPADFGMTMMAAFQKSLSFATFGTDTVPAPDRRAARTEQFEVASRRELTHRGQDRIGKSGGTSTRSSPAASAVSTL